MIASVVVAALLAADGGVLSPDAGSAESDVLHRLALEPDCASDAGEPCTAPEDVATESDGGNPIGADSDEAFLVGNEDGAASPAPSESVEEAPYETRAHAFGTLNAGGLVDLRFHPTPQFGPPEQVAEARSSVRVGVDLSLRPDVRLLIEGRVRWAGATQAGFERTKAQFEPTLGEAYLDLYFPKVDLRIGQQILTQGAQPLSAPQDVLAPRELRDDPLLLPSEEAKLPVFAVRATGDLAELRWTAIYVPFFVADRYAVFGDDQALLQPAGGGGLPVQLDPTIEDRLQDRLLETSRPADAAVFGDLSLAARHPLGPVTLGASWTWFTEKLPQVTLDPELELALESARRGRQLDPAVLLSLQNRFSAGETLMSGTYRRQHLFALDASALVHTVQVDADVAFTPGRTFVDSRLRPLTLPSLSWGATVAPAEDTDLVYGVSYQGVAVLQVPAERLLFLLEPATAQGAARTAFLHLISAAVRYTLLDGELTVGLQGAFEWVQGGYALTPEISWTPRPGLRLFGAVSLLGGPSRSVFGYFSRNDAAAVGMELALF